MDTRCSGEEDSSDTSTKSLNHKRKPLEARPWTLCAQSLAVVSAFAGRLQETKLCLWRGCCTHPESRGVGGLRCCSLVCTNGTISHVLPASIPALMNQAPLIADFTLSGPIVGLYRRGFNSSGQTLARGGWRGRCRKH